MQPPTPTIRAAIIHNGAKGCTVNRQNRNPTTPSASGWYRSDRNGNTARIRLTHGLPTGFHNKMVAMRTASLVSHDHGPLVNRKWRVSELMLPMASFCPGFHSFRLLVCDARFPWDQLGATCRGYPYLR